MSFQALLAKTMRGEPLGAEGARGAMDLIMSGEAGDIPTAAFLGALGPRALGAPALAGFARSRLSRARAETSSISAPAKSLLAPAP